MSEQNKIATVASVVYGSDTPRKTVPSQYQWKITDIFAEETAWQQAYQKVEAQLPLLKTFQGTLKDPASVLKALRQRDFLSQQVEKIYAYARLQQDADNTDSHFQALTGKAESLAAAFNNAASFFDPEILALSKSQRQSLLDSPLLAAYHFPLTDLFRQASHILSPDQEALLSKSQLATGTGISAFQALVSADMHFPDTVDQNGHKVSVSEGTYLVSLTSFDRTRRQNVFRTLMNTYHQYHNTLAATLTGACRSADFYARAKKYPNTITAALDEDNIPTSLHHTLITSAHQNLQPLHQYMSLKKKYLGYQSLHPYDLYVPFQDQGTSFYQFSFEEACSFILKALAPLGPQYLKVLQQAFSSGWIDRYENKGKRSGAYSWGSYGLHPYVLMSYQPSYRSLSTIAHELGHALHSYFTNETQPYPTSDYTIFCAEIASTTNEILLAEYALKQADKPQKIFLLNQLLENIRTTVYRQLQFAEFEEYIHGKVADGQSLQADDLDAYWLKSNQTYYGSALTVDKELAAEWSRIPHFYTPIYVYKYATGYSAATAFAQAILSGQSGAVEKYLHFLHAGASNYSLALLKEAGVDFTTPRPLEVTLQKFAQKLEEFKQLLGA